MQSRIASWLICVFLYGYLAPAAFAIRPVAQSPKVQQVRAVIEQLGTGEQTRVSVRLKSGARAKGYISTASDEGFTITDLNTGLHRGVRYSDVAQMHGQNLTSGQKYVVGLVFILAFFVGLIIAVKSDHS